jgi:hypothetical protein
LWTPHRGRGRRDDSPLSALTSQLLDRSPAGQCIRCYAVYAEPFWRAAGLTGVGTDLDDPPGLSIDIAPRDGRPGVLSAYIFGPPARHWAAASSAERKQVFLDGLVKRFGPQAASPEHYDERDWAAQEYSRRDMFAHYAPGVLTGFGRAFLKAAAAAPPYAPQTVHRRGRARPRTRPWPLHRGRASEAPIHYGFLLPPCWEIAIITQVVNFGGLQLVSGTVCAPAEDYIAMRQRRIRLELEPLEQRCLLSSDPILNWNAIAIEVNRLSYSGGVVNDQVGPTRSSRALAIESVAMFDAWNSIHRQFTPYLVRAPEANDASDVAAVAVAAHDTLVAMYPHQQAFIDAALGETLAELPDVPHTTRGIKVGRYVAQAVLAARADDRSQIPGQYTPDGLPGHHQADPLNLDQGFLTPAWGGVMPFGIPNTAAVPTPPVPSLTSAEYTQAFDQVKALGEENSTVRTLDQTEIGIYWGYDVARGLGDPPRLYNQIARVIAGQENNSVADNARMFALINIAMADAGIQCWGVKYRDICWRPIVAIRQAGTDGNPDTAVDPSWQPLGAPRSNPLPTEHVNFTPPFPSYTSGHATFGGAAFKIMADFYQTDDVHFSIPFTFISDEFNGVTTDIHQSIPPIILNYICQIEPRHFTSFSQAAAENAASRIFLGIHYRFDAIQGVSAGDRIADIDFDTLLRPLHGDRPTHVPSVDFAAQIDAYLNNTYLTFFASQRGRGGELDAYLNNTHLTLFTSQPGRGRGVELVIAPPTGAVNAMASLSANGLTSEKQDPSNHTDTVALGTHAIVPAASSTGRVNRPAKRQVWAQADELFS